MAKPPSSSVTANSLEPPVFEPPPLRHAELFSATDAPVEAPVSTVRNQAHQDTFKEVVAHYADDLSPQATPVRPAPQRIKRTMVSPEELSVDDHVTLEKHRLGIWMAKFAMIMMACIVTVLLGTTIYAVFTTKAIPEVSVLASLFTNLNDILLAVLNAGKTHE